MQMRILLGNFASYSSVHIVPREESMVLRNFASNKSRHTVPNVDTYGTKNIF
jgi:hypothetical protein